MNASCMIAGPVWTRDKVLHECLLHDCRLCLLTHNTAEKLRNNRKILCVVLRWLLICVLGSCEDVAVGLQPSGSKKYRLKNMYHHLHLSDSDRCRLMVHLFFIQFSLGARGSSLTLCAGSECSVRVQVCRLRLAGMPAGGLVGVAGL